MPPVETGPADGADGPGAPASTPFHRLEDFVALPRLGQLALSPDGRRVVVSVSTLAPDRKKHVSALWEVDPEGVDPATRLTRSAAGESAPVFTPAGDLLFLSARPDPEAPADAGDPKPALWCLPAAGGEAWLVARRPGGISGALVAADSGDVVLVASTMPGAADADADEQLRTARKDAGVTAILHEEYPVRHWDHDLGPAVPHLFHLGRLPSEAGTGPREPLVARDLTPDAGAPHGAGDDVALSPDGSLLVRSEQVLDGPAGRRSRLLLVDVAAATSTVLLDDPLADVYAPAFSPDGRTIVCSHMSASSYEEPPDHTLLLLDVGGGPARDLTPGFDRWPSAPQFSADGAAVYFLADDDGRHAVFRVPVGGGAPVRLTGDGAYSDLRVARDGGALLALRSSFAAPSEPVRLDPTATGQDPRPLPNPGTLPNPGALGALPGTLRELEATAADGTRVQSWLVLPEGAGADSPAPLVLWVHGGPLMSWNSWSWRWTPWVLAARGYAVLLPNPALSQGFGQDFVRRGWGSWGDAPFTDLMAAVDAAEALPEVDETRTAAMGGSFGGYMANWIASQTDRFRAIVTHASLWNLDAFSSTTDAGYYWQKEFGDPVTAAGRYEKNSPHRFADAIRTPMLVVHGDKDYRVPIGEGLALWYDLQRRGVPSRFLYFPDENHWVLQPGNARIWYETVIAFLAEHVLGEPWERPALL
ncbi:prolyl oligopeptidase family serine peptidase [Modestobacter sp. I12A-02628]|uniref:S9 family peptidase n=1 Tax=Goekera deserti TaxID=2497753 RepID=A0A7K3WKH1_9ACTN|nr:S9 family peptidase [Goekera deserti]MPQ96723.1 prolyl oligopeptidase family serine peptidase [Goekera deserti]NDI46963.1 prolyl oligopeptidase family serine peptidase [Goekera deserti]NEL56200.1 S9 family peptidase [Goekera deserti]